MKTLSCSQTCVGNVTNGSNERNGSNEIDVVNESLVCRTTDVSPGKGNPSGKWTNLSYQEMENGPCSRVCAEISLSNMEQNLDEIKRLLAPGAKVVCVIKADGYGHGAIPMARRMEEREEIWGYAVACPQEALSLREAGMKKPILILGYVFPEDITEMIALDVRLAVFSLEAAEDISQKAARLGKTAPIHIKLDTGMSRIGFPCTPDAADTIREIRALPNLEIEGIFTHFARSDEMDKTFARKQAARYDAMVSALFPDPAGRPLCHIANSAAIIDLPEYHKAMVRAGIILYGLWPSDEIDRNKIDLRPMMSLKSHIVRVRNLPAGETVSYGGTWEAKKDTRIATIPVGYADGYPRALSNKGCVLIHGKRAPIRGRVCMDMFMADISEIPESAVGDEVVLLGTQGTECITVEELGALSGRFNYEFACDISKRVPRVYLP